MTLKLYIEKIEPDWYNKIVSCTPKFLGYSIKWAQYLLKTYQTISNK